jgi:hypothetical protein
VRFASCVTSVALFVASASSCAENAESTGDGGASSEGNGGSSGVGAAGSTASSSTGATGGGTGGSAGGGAMGGAGGAGGNGGGATGSGGSGGGPPPVAEVYAHSATTLYRLDPITKALTTVGDFANCGGSVIDIAVDKSGEIWGARFSALVKIDKATAACTILAAGNYPTSLSFVPEGTLDPNEEALVGYVDDEYIRIDKQTGAITSIGLLGGGYTSSGDIVSLIAGGTYLTVKGNGCSDCLVEVDPVTGVLANMIGPLGYTKVFGLAYWAGVAYGFDDAGELVQIDVATAVSTPIALPNAPPGLSFFGAGSTTAAPHM